MAERSVEVKNAHGIHARPAAEICKVAGRFKAAIVLVKDDLEVNGKSIMGVMMLAAECGSMVLIRATGEDEEAAVEALAALITSGFGEG